MLYEFPQPPMPEEIDHGDEEGGWNFGGSMGFVYEVRPGTRRSLSTSGHEPTSKLSEALALRKG